MTIQLNKIIPLDKSLVNLKSYYYKKQIMKEEKGSKLDVFLWNLAGFKKSIISKCGIDNFHAKIIGVLLSIVGIYATLAWTFFFQTFTQNIFIAVLAGLFMGGFIVSFDRALISSLSSGKTNFFSLGFRFILAILLGIFLAQPMILRFYQPEISREVEILADKKVQERKTELEGLYQTDLANLQSQKTALQAEIDNTQQLFVGAEKDFKTEMDGSAGTKKYGYSTVAKQKEKIFESYKNELSTQRLANGPKMDKLQADIDAINLKVSSEIDLYQSENNVFGTLIQAEALESLLDKDSSGILKFRFYLLSLILILIELSALIAKMLFKMEGYKNRVSLIQTEEKQSFENEKELILAKLEELKALRLENESNLQKKYFEGSKEVSVEKLESLLKAWQSDEGASAMEYWGKFKNKLTLSGDY